VLRTWAVFSSIRGDSGILGAARSFLLLAWRRTRGGMDGLAQGRPLAPRAAGEPVRRLAKGSAGPGPLLGPHLATELVHLPDKPAGVPQNPRRSEKRKIHRKNRAERTYSIKQRQVSRVRGQGSAEEERGCRLSADP